MSSAQSAQVPVACSAAVVSGICTTAFKVGAVPESTLRTIMEKHQLPAELRIMIADTGFLTAAMFAAAGVDASHC